MKRVILFFLVVKLTNVIRFVIDSRISISNSEKLSAFHGLERPFIDASQSACTKPSLMVDD